MNVQQYLLVQEKPSEKQTLGHLVDSIYFNVISLLTKKKKPKNKCKTPSETDSFSSNHSLDTKYKSKMWTKEYNYQFEYLLKQHGTDFHILSGFFPRKTKNQLKNKYKQQVIMYKKREKIQAKEETNKLLAMSLLFKETKKYAEYMYLYDNKMIPEDKEIVPEYTDK